MFYVAMVYSRKFNYLKAGRSARAGRYTVARSRPSSVAAAVRRASEAKFHDFPINEDVGSGGTLINLTDIPSSTYQSGRIGNRIFVKSIYVRFLMACAATDENNVIRTVFARGKNRTLVIGDFPNHTYEIPDYDLMQTKKDYTYVSHLANDSAGVVKKFATFNIPINAYTKYDSSTSTDVLTGGLYLYLLSDSAAITHPTLVGTVRVNFKDV